MKEQLYTGLSAFFDIPKGTLQDKEVTLRDMMELSESAINSVDVMEGFAEVLEENDLSDKVDIPVFTLEERLVNVVDSITEQLVEKAEA